MSGGGGCRRRAAGRRGWPHVDSRPLTEATDSNSTTSPRYDPAAYWSRVGDRASERAGQAKYLAGDDTPFQRYKRESFVSRFLPSIDWSAKRVLEIGCGPGGNLLEVAKYVPQSLTGADIAPGMVELARLNTAGAPGIEIHQLSGPSLPFAEESFDIAFTVTVLQHNDFATVESLLSEMCRVSAEQVVLIEDMAARPRDPLASYHLRRPRDYAKVCDRSGFALAQIERLDVFASELAYYVLNSRLSPLSVSRQRAEGEGRRRMVLWIEGLAMQLTRWVDPHLAARVGLTKCTFARQTRGPGVRTGAYAAPPCA
jgi:SAM-dependent methyltransferase